MLRDGQRFQEVREGRTWPAIGKTLFIEDRI